MVVEHIFVSTLPREQALKRAADFLSKGGFVAQSQTAFMLDSNAWTALSVARGKANSSKYSAIPDLPQKVQIEWDRGRFTVAASISDRHSAKKRTQLLMAIVVGLEHLLVNNLDEARSAQPWLELDAELRRSGRWYRYRRWIFVLLVFGLWAAIAAYFSMR